MRVVGTTLTMPQGDSETLKISCADSDGVAIPFVTGDTIYFSVKTKLSDTAYAFQKIVTTFTDGSAIIYINPSDTESLSYNKDYLYDIQLTRADGTITTLVTTSKIRFEGVVTND